MLIDKTEPQRQALIDLVDMEYNIINVYEKHLKLTVKLWSKLDNGRSFELSLPVSGGWVKA